MTTWGSWTSDGRLEAGLALSMSPSTVNDSTASVTISWTLYGKSKYASYESGSTATPYSISGDISASGYGQGWNVGAGGTWVVASGSKTFSTSFTSTNTVNVTGRYTSSYAYPGDSPSVSAAITIPKRPYYPPAAPSACGWTRVSDTQQTVHWTNNSTSSAPYQSLKVERSTNGGSYSQIASISGSATSYTDSGTSTNHKYQYRVRAYNTSGYSGYSTSSAFYTTPAAPTNCTATKTSTGDITVSWTDASPYNDNFAVYHAANGVWDGAALTTTQTSSPYTHTAPSTTVTHEYRITAHVPTPSLNSGYSNTSDTVQLLSAPNAPTQLVTDATFGGPNVSVIDGSNTIFLNWQYNPVDTTPQTAFEVQYQVDGGAFTSMGKATSSQWNSSVTPGGWGANGHTIGWQVRTWGSATTGGSDGTGASPWSTTKTVTLSSQPVAVVNVPDGTTAIATSSVDVQWGYSQAEGSAQASWKVKLYDASMNLIETQSGNGTDSDHVMNTVLANGASYTVGVIVTSAAGLTSDEAQQPMTVSFALPPAPTIAATWDAGSGAVNLLVDTPDPVSPQIAADHIQVWRQTGDDLTYYLVADYVPLGSTVNDFIPALRATNNYIAVAITTLPSSQASAAVPVDTTPGCHHVWVNAGGSFSQSVCFTTGIDLSLDDGVQKVLNQYAGRTKPVETTGEQTLYAVTLRANIFDPSVASSIAAETSTVAEIGAIAKLPAPACLRTPDGIRRFVSLSTPSFSSLGPSKVRGVAWGLTETDFNEQTGLSV